MIEGTEEFFDKCSKLYGIPKKIPLFLRWNFDKILGYIPKKGSPTVLDLGTGNGILLVQNRRHNPSCKLIGVDFSQGMLDQARRNIEELGMEAKLIKCDLTEIPLEDNSVDYIISNNSLHHVNNKGRLYSEIYRLLKTNKILVYSDSHDAPDMEFDKAKQDWLMKDNDFAVKYKESADAFWQALPEQIKQNHPEEYHYPFDEVRTFLKNSGFKNIEILPSPSYFAIVSAEK